MKSNPRVVLGLAAALLLFVRPAAARPAVTETEEVVYVVNSYVHAATALDWSTFSMLRGTTLASLKTLTIAGHGAHSVAVTPDGQRAWITVSGADRIDVVDTTAFSVIRGIDTGPAAPQGVTITRDGRFAWVTYSDTGEVVVFNALTGLLLERIPVGGYPNCILLTPDGRKAYAVDYQTPQVVAIETAGPDGTVVATIPFGGHALQDAVVSPDGRRLYVANMDEGQVEVIDTTTDTVLAPIPTDPRPRGIGVSPDGRYLFVGHWNPAGLPVPGHAISMIRLADNVVVAALEGNGNFRRLAVRADGTRIFVADHDNDGAIAIDVVGETLRVARLEDLNTVPGQHASPVGVAIGQYRTPIARVTLNGSDGPVRLTRADSARLALSLDANGRTDDADWWLAGAGPTGVFYWTPASGWTRTVRPAFQGALASGSFSGPAVSLAGWPAGTYVFAFAVDVKRDGLLSTRYLYSDTVTMVVSE